MKTQFEIIQEIADRIFLEVDDNWKEIIATYQVEGHRSREIITFLYEKNGIEIEKSLPNVNGFSTLMRELRDHLAQSGKQKFTKCKLHIKSDGYFNTDYSYDTPSWEIKTNGSDWNFDTVHKE